MKLIIFFLSLIGFSTSLFAADSTIAAVGYREEIAIGDGTTLAIIQDTESAVSVEILSGEDKYLQYRFTVENAGFTINDVKPLTFDKNSQSPAYLINIFDRSSSYGAATGVIVYSKAWWGMAIVPDDVFDVKDVDGDGVYEVIGQRLNKKTFQFDAGTFKEK